jgi:hypothetical protein
VWQVESLPIKASGGIVGWSQFKQQQKGWYFLTTGPDSVKYAACVLLKKTAIVKRPKFGNGPYLRHLFSDDIFPGIKLVDTISKSKRLLLLSSSTVEFCGEELKCHLLTCISFVYLTKQCRI